MPSYVQGASISVDGGIAGMPSPARTWQSVWDNWTVDFDRDAFTRVIADKGYEVVWEKATFCPNRPASDTAPRSHDIDCTVCGGSGFLHYDPQETRMLVTGVTLAEHYYTQGRWDLGSIRVTSLPEERLSRWDRLTMRNGVARFAELVRRTSSGVIRLKYKPIEMLSVFWMGRDGAERVTDISDIRVTNDIVSWTTSPVPDPGTLISVAYAFRPRYVVLDLQHQHRESTVKGKHYEFPCMAVARADFLVRDESRDEAEDTYQNPFPER